MANATNQKKPTTGGRRRRYMPARLVLPADQVSYEPPEDLPEDIREYLFAYARTGSRAGACRLIGRSTRWAYAREAELGERLLEEERKAYQNVISSIEETLAHRAHYEPGMPGVTSAIFLLKAADPQRFAERQELRHSGHISVDWVSFMREGVEEE